MNNKDFIKQQLIQARLQRGDTLLVRAGLRSINMEKKSDFLEALLEILGSKGTLMGLSFSKSHFFPFISKKIFTKESTTSSGGFSRAMLSHPESYRSLHPTNSYVAIGENADYILKGHNENSKCYTPISKLIELRGKMLLAGCIDSSPGFTTIHYAQEVLGLTEKSFLKNLKGTKYKKEGITKTFFRKDYGGCSIGFKKFYSLYLQKGLLHQFKVGDAQSMIIDAKKAYEIDLNILKTKPRYLLCDNHICFSCRVTWKNNKKDIIPYFTNLFLKRFFKINS